MKSTKLKSKGLAHYNTNGSTLIGKSARARWGSRERPIPGSKFRIRDFSPYVGERVTPENKVQYMLNKKKQFTEDYIRSKEAEDEPVDLQFLDILSTEYAHFEARKNTKHYRAWLKGAQYFTYKGNKFPVLTQEFMDRSESLKEEHLKEAGIADMDVSTITDAKGTVTTGYSQDIGLTKIP